MGKPDSFDDHGKIFLDREGRWFHEGVEITHRRTLELFSRSVGRDGEGGYRLRIGREQARIEVEDTPYLVREVSFRGEQVELKLNDGSLEILDPGTLRIGAANVLYCDVKSEKLPARFLRPAYYQLTGRMEQDRDGYFLQVAGNKHYLRDQGAETAAARSRP
jgi:uncharacterized protein